MNTNRIFLSNVMCGEGLVATNIVLLKCKNDVYVALNNVNSLIDIYKINHKKTNLLTYPIA